MSAPVVFIHSTGTGPAMWDPVPADVVAPDAAVKVVNLGYPPGPPIARGTKVTLADEVAHVLAQVPAAGVHLVGHSYGGLVALDLAGRLGSRVRSMVLFEPVLFGALAKDETADPAAVAEARGFLADPWFLTDESRGGTEPWLEMFVDYWNRPGSWARMPEPLRAANLALGWKMFQEVRSVFFETASFDERPLPAVPVTLVRTERSPVAARAMVAELARRAPHAKVVELAGTGHMAPLTHPAKATEALRAHFASLG